MFCFAACYTVKTFYYLEYDGGSCKMFNLHRSIYFLKFDFQLVANLLGTRNHQAEIYYNKLEGTNATAIYILLDVHIRNSSKMFQNK